MAVAQTAARLATSKVRRRPSARRFRSPAGRRAAQRMYVRRRALPQPLLYAANDNFDGLQPEDIELLIENNPQTASAVSQLWGAYKKIRAVLTSWMIGAMFVPVWWIIFILWIWHMGGFAAESIPLASFVLPGETVFTITLFSASTLGSLFMLLAAAIYTIRLVDCWSGWKLMLFCICFVLCWMPFMFIVPWVWLWCLSVAILQNRNTQAGQFA